jgi:hypothetical protein
VAGRLSFGGFNPAIEKVASGAKVVPSIFADVDEDGNEINDKDMMSRFKKYVGLRRGGAAPGGGGGSGRGGGHRGGGGHQGGGHQGGGHGGHGGHSKKADKPRSGGGGGGSDKGASKRQRT